MDQNDRLASSNDPDMEGLTIMKDYLGHNGAFRLSGNIHSIVPGLMPQ